MEPVKPASHYRIGTGARHLAVRALDWVVPEENPAESIYGTITIGALLAGESALRDTYPETVGSVAVAILIYWLARSYATLLGRRLTVGERLSVTELGRALAHDWAIVRGSGLPLLALLVAWASGASQQTGATAALWTCVGSLLTFELLAGLRTRARPAELALELCVGATMGLGVIALKVILH
jgi:membrane protein YqaA with SNARE-associated domain